MPTPYKYGCTQCGRSCAREILTVKRVQFVEMGEGASTKKSRVLEWLCPSCLSQDLDFLRDKFVPPVQELAHGNV